jgi:glycosyltransferase involved in cell wall biosynthesis
VAVADVIADRLSAAGLCGVELSVIRNAVTSLPAPDRDAAREQLNIPTRARVALCLARMVPQKRHDVLLDAWAQLTGGQILLLAGDGPERHDLEERARPLGDRVRFLGNRSDVSTLLAAADVTVLTSDWEGLPISILESLAAGRPVVATDVDGVREILGPGGGRLVPRGDSAAAAASLREMLHDDASRREAARIGLSTIQKFYDPASMVNRYNDVINEALPRKEITCVP